MANQNLHIAATAGWRALLTHAQHAAGVGLTAPVEEHLVTMLYRYVGADVTPSDIENGLLDRMDRVVNADTSKRSVVGDQCLLFAGLIPEHAIRKGLPIAYFVQLGCDAYRQHSSRHESTLYAALADEFVVAMDTLQTLRVMQCGQPCIDGFNAFHLWHDHGSRHGWRVLQSMTSSLPASCSTSQCVH
jgi:hypothetical protein